MSNSESGISWFLLKRTMYAEYQHLIWIWVSSNRIESPGAIANSFPFLLFLFLFPFSPLSSSSVSRSAFHKNVLDKKRSGVALPKKKLCQNFSQKCFAPHFYPLATANRGMPRHCYARRGTHRAQLSFNGHWKLFIVEFLLVFLRFFSFFNSEPIEMGR